jgi:hypothetical protein
MTYACIKKMKIEDMRQFHAVEFEKDKNNIAVLVIASTAI